MTAVQLLGLLAGSLTTIAFLPQVLRAYRTKSTKDVSLTMMVVFTAGLIAWLVYGSMVGDLPLILANGVTFFLVMLLLIAKFRGG